MFETTWKGIRLPNDTELENWNPKLIHFVLQRPKFFLSLIDNILSNSKDLGINIKLENEERFLIEQYRRIIKNGASGKD